MSNRTHYRHRLKGIVFLLMGFFVLTMADPGPLAASQYGFDQANCKPIPASWKPGSQVEWYNLLKMHEKYQTSSDPDQVKLPRISSGSVESRLMRPRIRKVMEDYCLWAQKIGSKWYTVAGKGATFEPQPDQLSGQDKSLDPAYRIFDHPKHSQLSVKTATFEKRLNMPPLTLNRHGCGPSVCEYEGHIDFLEAKGQDQYIVAVYFMKFDPHGTVTKLHKCAMDFGPSAVRIKECGFGVTRPAFYENDTRGKAVVNLINAQLRSPGIYVGGKNRGNASILNAPADKAIWQTTLGPMAVYRDDPAVEGKPQFIAKWNEHLHGIVRMFTKDGVNYEGTYVRQCVLEADGSFDVNSRYYSGCAASDVAPKIKEQDNWRVRYEDVEGNPSSCWGRISGQKNVQTGQFEGFIDKCASFGKVSVQPRPYNRTGFVALLPQADDDLERQRRELEKLRAQRDAAEADRLRREAEAEARRKELERQKLDAEIAAEQRRLAEEAEQRRLAEEAEQRRLAKEAERRRLAEEQARLDRLAKLNVGSIKSSAGGEVWQSDWGPIVVAVDEGGKFTARYNDQANGWVSMGSADGLAYRGHWARSCGENESGCGSTGTARGGVQSHCWGELWGRVNQANTQFTGNWNYCGNKAIGGVWNGHR